MIAWGCDYTGQSQEIRWISIPYLFSNPVKDFVDEPRLLEGRTSGQRKLARPKNCRTVRVA